MKIPFLAAFVLSVFALSSLGAAQDLSTYSIDADVNKDGVAKVKLVMVFAEPEGKLEFFLPFRISDFNVTSTAGPVSCENALGDVSVISCDLQLTDSRKTIEMAFQTPEMVRKIGNGFLFSGDFSPRMATDTVLAAVRIPEGMVLSQNVPGGSTVPFSNSTSTDGRKITVIWRLSELSQSTPVSFQVFYEPGIEPVQSEWIQLRWIVLAGIIVAGGVGGGALLLISRRKRKTQEVVLSVLDDYEKRVITAIEKEGGTANQKKVVTDTNLSKAKVSRVVQKLEERGLLEVERKGRTNILKFSKKKLGE